MKEEERASLVTLLQEFRSLNPLFEVPSRHTLSRYITAFFGGFHSHFPFIHTPTYNPTCSPVELTLAICATGAQYCFETRSSERLFTLAEAIAFERLRREENRFSSQARSLAMSRISVGPVVGQHLGPWTPLDLAKTLLILVGFATWAKSDLLERAFCMRDLLVHVLRDVGLQEADTDSLPTSSPAARWDHWIQAESARRTKLVAFTYINVHSIAYNVRPSLWTSELNLRLPCRTTEWQAPSPAQWTNLRRDDTEDQMMFQDALLALLSPTTSSTVQPIPSPIGNYILLHALLQRIYIIRELSYSINPISLISAHDLHVVSYVIPCVIA